ncbi:MAG: hypothetical protein P8Y44_01530, partial [Acidobacteriota bacterium]
MKDLVFADAWLLWVLVPLFLLWSVAWWVLPWLQKKRRQRASLRYSSIDTLQRLRPSRTIILRKFVEALRLVA